MLVFTTHKASQRYQQDLQKLNEIYEILKDIKHNQDPKLKPWSPILS